MSGCILLCDGEAAESDVRARNGGELAGTAFLASPPFARDAPACARMLADLPCTRVHTEIHERFVRFSFMLTLSPTRPAPPPRHPSSPTETRTLPPALTPRDATHAVRGRLMPPPPPTRASLSRRAPRNAMMPIDVLPTTDRQLPGEKLFHSNWPCAYYGRDYAGHVITMEVRCRGGSSHRAVDATPPRST